jgi:hypothetical protein
VQLLPGSPRVSSIPTDSAFSRSHLHAATVFGFLAASGAVLLAQPPFDGTIPAAQPVTGPFAEVGSALLRLPLAAALGTALALRPRRPGTPARSMPVVETQIILAIVGALIMLIVGASLARTFGIVGAANLIRYRAKMEDPKDAVVMLAALAVGLACDVGLYLRELRTSLEEGVRAHHQGQGRRPRPSPAH